MNQNWYEIARAALYAFLAYLAANAVISFFVFAAFFGMFACMSACMLLAFVTGSGWLPLL